LALKSSNTDHSVVPAQVKGKFDYVDAIRGFAILAVMAVHVGQQIAHLPFALSEVTRLGNIGVQLFFVASAFTLSLSMSRRKSFEKKPARNYFLRRYFRIAPMYYFGIVMYYVLRVIYKGTLQPEGYDLLSVITNFTFTHGFSPDTFNYIVPGGWSIAVEFSFYLIFPTLFKIIKNERHVFVFIFATIILAFVGAPVWDAIYGVDSNLHSFKYYVFTTQYSNFGFGILLYFLWKRTDQIQKYVNRSRKVISLFWFFIGAAVFVIAYMLNAIPNYYLIKPTIYSMSFLFFSLSLINYEWRVFVNQFSIRIGQLSYSLYITHFVFAWFVVPEIMRLSPIQFSSSIIRFSISYILTLGLSFLFALATNHFVENKGIQMGKDIIRQLESGHHLKAISFVFLRRK
jgi:peptidoglycan/LPS O-acetylase OafA/YrhL